MTRLSNTGLTHWLHYSLWLLRAKWAGCCSDWATALGGLRCLSTLSRDGGKSTRSSLGRDKEFLSGRTCVSLCAVFPLDCFSLRLHFPYLSISLTCRFLFLAVSCPCLCYHGGCLYPTAATNCHVPGCRLASYCARVTNSSGKRWIFAASFAQPALASNYGGESVDDRGLGGRCRCSDRRGRCGKGDRHKSPREVRCRSPWFRFTIDTKWEAVDSSLSVELAD